jgi:hypothetical protein
LAGGCSFRVDECAMVIGAPRTARHVRRRRPGAGPRNLSVRRRDRPIRFLDGRLIDNTPNDAILFGLSDFPPIRGPGLEPAQTSNSGSIFRPRERMTVEIGLQFRGVRSACCDGHLGAWRLRPK